ncbi:MAG: TPM domain-containing protein [Bacteroidales bacterium]|nr:TPM domain-containing protein [Bacteroidales bacterium]
MKTKLYRFFLLVWMLLLIGPAMAQVEDFPERPQPPQIVNDFAEVLSPSEQSQLEQKLVRFNRETSTQIAVVTLNDLRGYAISDYAVRLAHEWGVGQEGKDNGILILVSPENQRVFIATGYGLEGAVPDATAQQIVDNEILPLFRQGNYYKGLEQATTVLFDLTRGEYTAEQYNKKVGGSKESQAPYPIGLLFLLVIIFAVVGRIRRARHYSMGHGVPFWAALTMLGAASHRQHGSFSNFSSGSGGFSGGMGGGGGFGGFGGGGFGGGGAGGGW